MSLARNLYNKHGKKLLNTATKTVQDALKTASKKIINKAAEATGEFIGNKIADKTVKPNPLNVEEMKCSRNVQEILKK